MSTPTHDEDRKRAEQTTRFEKQPEKPHGPVGEHFMRHYYGAAKPAPQQTSDSKLPPLPSLPPVKIDLVDDIYRIMENYAAAVRAATIEECAKVCETKVKRPVGYAGQWEGYGPFDGPMTGSECAAAIRALK